MSAFGVFAILLLVATTVFALANPTPVTVRFMNWQAQTTLALAMIASAVIGAFLVLVSSLIGQRGVRARLREAQARIRTLEARQQPAAGSDTATRP